MTSQMAGALAVSLLPSHCTLNNNIPLLACISGSGSIHKFEPDTLIVDFRRYTTLEHVKVQLFQGEPNAYDLIIIPDETNVTKIMLNPLHRLHRLASDVMVPDLVFNDESSYVNKVRFEVSIHCFPQLAKEKVIEHITYIRIGNLTLALISSRGPGAHVNLIIQAINLSNNIS